MSVIGWFVGIVLMILSFILWVAGLMGREGVLRIGRQTAAERRDESKAGLRPVNAFNVVLGIVGILVGLAVVLVFAT